MTHDPWDLFLGFWERLGWRVRHERARYFSSPARDVGYRWPYPAFS
jgi:hypothetical protein